MGKKGRKFVEENFDRNIVIEAYYDKIFDRKEVKLVKDARIKVAKEEIEALKDIEG